MADFLGTKHHELHFTVQEGLDCLHDLIYHLESFEQVRCSYLHHKSCRAAPSPSEAGCAAESLGSVDGISCRRFKSMTSHNALSDDIQAH